MNNKLSKTAFPDQIRKVNYKTHSYKTGSTEAEDWKESLVVGGLEDEEGRPLLSNWRRLILVMIILITFSGIFLRLFHLQIVSGADNRQLADSNRIKIKVIHAPRGVIYDRNGKILAQNEPAFRLLEASTSGQAARHISRDQELQMEVSQDPKLKDLEIDNNRSYPFGEKTAHVLGYTSEINGDEFKSAEFQNYKLGDRIGRGGIEQSYEKVLRGVDGGEIIEIDAAGKKIRTLGETPAIPGQNLYLTLDADLQNLVYDQLIDGVKKSGSCCGAAIAQDPKTGEILSLVSYPSYDYKKLTDALVAPNS